jgi:hypothetical protein
MKDSTEGTPMPLKQVGSSLLGGGLVILLAMAAIWIVWTVIEQVFVYGAMESPHR